MADNLNLETASLMEVIEWLHQSDGWSKDWFDDELYPVLKKRFGEDCIEPHSP